MYRKCQWCGKDFLLLSDKSPAKYCSKKCKSKASYDRSKEREMRKALGLPPIEPVVRYCAVCGQRLRTGQKLFCSHDCLRTYHARKREEAREELERSAEKNEQKMKAYASWPEILQGMKETGLQYGEYVTKYEGE